jgi:hypothetical protein
MQETKTKVKASDEGNCGVARRRGIEAGVKAASSRTETGYEAGDADKSAPHDEVPVSASQVKPGVVPRKSRPLPGETCPAGGAARERGAGTVLGNKYGERTGVSRGRSSARNEPGVGDHPKWGAPKAPEGLTPARRTKLVRTAETAAAFQLTLALSGAGGETEREQAAEKDRGRGERWGPPHRSPFITRHQRQRRQQVIRSEPPGTDPYAGWYGGRRLITSGYPIRLFFFTNNRPFITASQSMPGGILEM